MSQVVFGAKHFNFKRKIPPWVRDEARKIYVKKTERLAFDVLVVNLMSCIKGNNQLIYPRDKRPFRSLRRKFTSATLFKVIGKMEEMGLVENHIGVGSKNANYRESSMLIVTDKFKEVFKVDQKKAEQSYVDYVEEYITVSDSTGRDIDQAIEDAEDEVAEGLKSMRERVKALNLHNSQYEYSLLVDGKPKVLDMMYTRVFCGDFDLGGRWYRSDVLAIKNKDSHARLDIKIDGEDVVEVDYSNLHIRIVAALYGYDTFSSLPLDVYTGILEPEAPKVDRSIVKMAMCIMLNSESRQKARAALQSFINAIPKADKIGATMLNATMVITALYERYKEFSDVLCKDAKFGLALQNEDSNLSDKIAALFVAENEPLLIVHDSYLTKKKNVDMLITSMGECFRRKYGIDCPVPVTVEMKVDGVYTKDNVLA